MQHDHTFQKKLTSSPPSKSSQGIRLAVLALKLTCRLMIHMYVLFLLACEISVKISYLLTFGPESREMICTEYTAGNETERICNMAQVSIFVHFARLFTFNKK